jgi:hypothetical protein
MILFVLAQAAQAAEGMPGNDWIGRFLFWIVVVGMVGGLSPVAWKSIIHPALNRAASKLRSETGDAQIVADLASIKTSIESIEKDVDGMKATMERRRLEQSTKSSAALSTVHKRIDEVEKKVAYQGGEMQGLKGELSQTNAYLRMIFPTLLNHPEAKKPKEKE